MRFRRIPARCFERAVLSGREIGARVEGVQGRRGVGVGWWCWWGVCFLGGDEGSLGGREGGGGDVRSLGPLVDGSYSQ